MFISADIQRNLLHPRALTFKCLIELVFPKDDAQVVNGTGVKLHPEYHISTGAAVALVVALELEGENYQLK